VSARAAAPAAALATVAVLGAPALLLGPAQAATCVDVVVDYGTAAGAPSGPSRACVSLSGGDTGARVLTTRYRQLGTPKPRWNGEFLCGIDGYPETGCGTTAGSPYWSYWHKRGGCWVYSSLGPVSHTVRDDDGDGRPDPEGWRYQSPNVRAVPRDGSPECGTGGAARPTPRASSPRPSRPATSSPPARPARTAAPTTAARTAAAEGTGTTAPSPGTATDADPLGTASPSAPGSTAPAGRATSAGPQVSPGSGSAGEPTPTTDRPLVVAQPDDASDLPVGTLVGAGLVTLLGGAAAWRFRHPRS
jgi:hypothetical protein